MELTKSVEISAQPEEIWTYLVDPRRLLEWNSTFQKFEYTGVKKRGVGTTFYVEEEATGLLRKIHFVVTQWDENRELGFEMKSGSGLKSYSQRWTITSTKPGGSTFTFSEKVERPLGPVGKFLGSLGQRASETAVEQILRNLKMIVESESVRVWR